MHHVASIKNPVKNPVNPSEDKEAVNFVKDFVDVFHPAVSRRDFFWGETRMTNAFVCFLVFIFYFFVEK